MAHVASLIVAFLTAAPVLNESEDTGVENANTWEGCKVALETCLDETRYLIPSLQCC